MKITGEKRGRLLQYIFEAINYDYCDDISCIFVFFCLSIIAVTFMTCLHIWFSEILQLCEVHIIPLSLQISPTGEAEKDITFAFMLPL